MRFTLSNGDTLIESLYPFQKECVEYALQKRGRILIGDEMGVGKTIEALAICAVYKDNWPILILCPSSLKYNWKNEAEKWLRSFAKRRDIKIVEKQSDDLKSKKVVIVSYDMAK